MGLAPVAPREVAGTKMDWKSGPSLRRFGLVAALLGLGAGCIGSPWKVEYDRSRMVTNDGPHRVRSIGIDAVFLKPGARFSGYEAVMIDPVTVSYASEPRPPTLMLNPRAGNFALSEDSMDRLKQIFRETFAREFAHSAAFAVVDEPGPKVLRLSGHIVKLVWDAPPVRAGRIDFVLDAGEMTLILGVRDAQTGEALARVADRRLIRPGTAAAGGSFESNPVNNWGGVRQVYAAWARYLRADLDDLWRLDEVPAPPEP
jgi:hypothetical protein